jgi:Ser/Thr protein kinase RdoA (MazF antagonist)
VSSFLKAWILHRFEKLEAQKGIDEYEAMLLPAIRDFVHNKLDSRLPKGLDEIPVVLMHTDLGLHNVLLSLNPPFDLAAVIDWEFTSCLPFLCAVPRLIDPMLREGLKGGEKAILEAVQLLREAFWNEIPA